MMFSQAPTADDLVTIHKATQSEIDAMTGLYEGSLIYNSDVKALFQYSGTAWQKLTPKGDETKIITDGSVTISGSGTTTDPYLITGIKATFTDNGDGSYSFSNGIDPDVNFSPSAPGNSPVVINSNANGGNCDSLGLNETGEIVIIGNYFDGSSTVNIVGQTVNSIVINSISQITANITSGATAGNYDITVTNNVGSHTLTGGFVLQGSSPLTTYNISTADMTLTPGTITYDGNILQKTGNNGWNAHGYSLAHELKTSSGGRLDWTANQSNLLGMVGLSYNPASSASYPNLEFAMYMVSNSRIQIRENGTSKGYVTTYATGDVLSIDVDCLGNVVYLQNGNTIYVSDKKAINSLYFDTSIYHKNMAISNIQISY